MAAPQKQKPESEEDIKRAVTISDRAIQEEYVQLPATLSKWIVLRVAAAKVHRLAELDLEVGEAKLGLDVRAANDAAMAAAGPGEKVKKVTVDEVEALVVTHPRYRELAAAVIDAAEVKERAAGMVDAIHAKREMLVSLGADLRSEKEGDPSIRDRSRR